MKKKRVLVGTFSVWKKGKRTTISGMIDPLVSYFSRRTRELVIIDGTHPGSSTVCSYAQVYKNGKKRHTHTLLVSRILSAFLRRTNTDATQAIFKLRDFLCVFEWLIRRRARYDLFIGLESVYTLAGIIARKMGIVKTVVYYVSDYSPSRYDNAIFNRVYLALDRLCSYHADFIWDVSPAMHPARIEAGLTASKSAPRIVVPNALYKEQIAYLPVKRLTPYSLVFAGTLGPENGPQIAIRALPEVVKTLERAKLHIIGGNDPYENRLKKLAKKLNVSSHVVFHGFISDQEKLSRLTRTYMLGLAPYASIPGSPRWYADATKIRLYMGAGIPVITTRVPPLGREIEKCGAGLAVGDTPHEFAKAIIDILSDSGMYKNMRKKAIAFARHNTWDNTYTNALQAMEMM